MGDNNTHKEQEGKYEMMQTKVSPQTFRLMNRIAAKKGLSTYEMIQMVIDTLVRYMDDTHNLTPEMEEAMRIFEHMEGWNQAFNLADPTVQHEVGEATYYVQDPDGKRSGVRGVHVTKPFFGKRTETHNIKEILERTFNLLIPERYIQLRRLAVDLECNSILELIDFMLEYHGNDADTAEFRKTFEDCQRHDWGDKIEYGQRTKRVHKGDIEKQPGLFDLDDLDFKPHGGEW